MLCDCKGVLGDVGECTGDCIRAGLRRPTYQFERWGALIEYDGLPLYAGKRHLTNRRLVWWWPWNWVLVLMALPLALWRALRRRGGR
jgi:hypothetical protein